MDSYGKEVIIDLVDCKSDTFNRKSIKGYCIELCKLIDMERCDLHFWDYKWYPKEYEEAPDHLKGTSAVQFIKTSNITIHTLDVLKSVFLNVFSCKDFDLNTVVEFSEGWFGGKCLDFHLVSRGKK